MDLFRGVSKIYPHLNYTWKRHKVILSNLANVDTPNYKTKDVAFYVEEGSKLKTTRDKHLSSFRVEDFRVFELRKKLVGNDLNNVSLEEEMTKLSQNRIAYEVYMKMALGSLEKLNNIIKEGRQ
ncbi:MAG: flagellar basal body rod protein FlgB [Acidobacteria bacterium]|jgi:flagellar basal-body rod protein FlgB|nr:MAG: flagellar basal body rod protein FlgB [Acidobacteriota bacterium]